MELILLMLAGYTMPIVDYKDMRRLFASEIYEPAIMPLARKMFEEAK